MNARTVRDDCPVCGQPAALIALGVRYDRLHRWRPWIITATHLALCSACDALVVTEGSGAAFRPSRQGAAPAAA